MTHKGRGLHVCGANQWVDAVVGLEQTDVVNENGSEKKKTANDTDPFL